MIEAKVLWFYRQYIAVHVVKDLLSGIAHNVALQARTGDGTEDNHSAIQLICEICQGDFGSANNDVHIVTG